jgi:hypothetical protein
VAEASMTLGFASLLTIVILLLMEAGRQCRLRREGRKPETPSGGSSAVDASVFGLMGLLIAFTFYGAETRFETRRSLLVEEANAIDSAYLRLDLLPPGAQPELRDLFRQYVHSRLTLYQRIPDWEAVGAMRRELDHSTALQREIWRQAVASTKQPDYSTAQSLVVPSIDRMIDIATTQTVAFQRHPPIAVWGMLALTLLASCVLAGYSMAGSGARNWVHILVFALLFSAVIYINVDFEYPRMRGFIRIDDMDKLLVQTLEHMK